MRVLCISFFLTFSHSQAFICIALILGDGIYNFTKIILKTVMSMLDKSKQKNAKNGKQLNLSGFCLPDV